MGSTTNTAGEQREPITNKWKAHLQRRSVDSRAFLGSLSLSAPAQEDRDEGTGFRSGVQRQCSASTRLGKKLSAKTSAASQILRSVLNADQAVYDN